MSQYTHCKEGCILNPEGDPGQAHRTPIDCVTVPDLWKELEKRDAIETSYKELVKKLKAEIYDLREEDLR